MRRLLVSPHAPDSRQPRGSLLCTTTLERNTCRSGTVRSSIESWWTTMESGCSERAAQHNDIIVHHSGSRSSLSFIGARRNVGTPPWYRRKTGSPPFTTLPQAIGLFPSLWSPSSIYLFVSTILQQSGPSCLCHLLSIPGTQTKLYNPVPSDNMNATRSPPRMLTISITQPNGPFQSPSTTLLNWKKDQQRGDFLFKLPRKFSSTIGSIIKNLKWTELHKIILKRSLVRL